MIALAEAGFARRSQSAGGAEPFEGSAVNVGFARRSQSAGGPGPFEGPGVKIGGQRVPLAIAGAVALGLLLPAGPAAAGSLVVLLRSPAGDSLARQSETLLAAELRASGFDVGEQERSADTDLRGDMESAARRLRPIAVLALTPVAGAGPAAAEISLLDRVTGKLVIRRIEPGPATRPASAAGDLALRAVELLRGSLLEIALAPTGPDPPAAPADVSRFVTGDGAGVLAVRRSFFVQGLGLGAGVSALRELAGAGASYAPVLRVALGGGRLGPRLALRISALGLGSAARAQAQDAGQSLGTVKMKRSLALVEGLLAFRRDATVQPFLSVGLGLHHLRASGTGATPLFADHQVSRLAPAFAGGGGLALRLGRQAALLLELQGVALATVTPVMVADQRVARVGRPAALLSLGLLASL